MGMHCHNITTHTPRSGYHGITEVAKTTNIAKTHDNCMNCSTPHPTMPHKNPMESGPGDTFLPQNRKKTKRFMIFDPKKKEGVIFSTIPTPQPRPKPPSKAQKRGYQVEGV